MIDRDDRDLPETVEGVVCSRAAEGAVLLSTELEVYFGLNETGARIWELLSDCDTVDGLCRELGREYPEVDPDVLRRDVRELLEELAEEGLVRWEEDGGRAPGDGENGG